MTDEEAERLRASVRRAERRRRKAERERPTVMAQTAYLGMLGLLIALPIVAGAYLGEWLDRRIHGFSVSWTVTFLIIGVAVGTFNAWWFVRERS
jgi:ATP synthase protein I